MSYLAALFVALGLSIMGGAIVGAQRYLKYGELSVEHLIGFRVVAFLGALLLASGLVLWGAV